MPPRLEDIDHCQLVSDPLIEMANQAHAKWKKGECSSAEKENIHKEAVDHLKKNAVAKERKAWAGVLQEGNSKTVWDKIN